MEWGVEYTDHFEEWWNGLDSAEQEDVAAKVGLLEECGPALGRPYRILFAFDPRRSAILLIGGDKTGRDAGMRNTYRAPIGCMTNISRRCGAKIERAVGRNDDG